MVIKYEHSLLFTLNFVSLVDLISLLWDNKLPEFFVPSFTTLSCLHHFYLLLFKARTINTLDSTSPIFSSTFLHLLSDFSIDLKFSLSSLVINCRDILAKRCKDIVCRWYCSIFCNSEERKTTQIFISRGLTNLWWINKDTYTVA